MVKERWGTLNTEHRTLNLERSASVASGLLSVILFFGMAFPLFAQPHSTGAPPLDPLLQLMLSQPSIEVTSNVVITAEFDPPTIRPDEDSIYRVKINAISDSVSWPDRLSAPPELNLHFTARGQILFPFENKLKPQTAINYHAQPKDTGSYTVPSFTVEVYGKKISVPEARLEVSATATSRPPQRLQLELEETNVYVGQPVKARVLLRSASGNVIQTVQELNFNGDHLLADQSAARQTIASLPVDGRNVVTYVYETTLTPLAAGPLTVSAQGFTAGNRMLGTIVIQGQATLPGGPPKFELLDSDPVTLQARPLPRANALPGFTGWIGKLFLDSARLSANQAHVGELVKLTVTFRGEESLSRLVPPPPPVSRDWQVFDATPAAPAPQSNGRPVLPGTAAGFAYTLIPLTTNVTETPAIPFSVFDPERGVYLDLSIEPMPINVLPGDRPSDPAVLALSKADEAQPPKLRLSDVTEKRGRTVATLIPLQRRAWFIGLQILPLAIFLGLWKWEQRRRFLETHPEIVLFRRTRRALLRERRKMRSLRAARDGKRYAETVVNALRIAVAPHYPAAPNALVGGDVIKVLGNPARDETIRRFFAFTDATQFSNETTVADDLLRCDADVESALDELEKKLCAN
ncbi:MAG TPA: BatD family protein [Verrucomicrobiae bacterium]|nr:BatD family protein [Verrucomicrobiae bacterium]